jgi:hypothetical protein
MKTKNRNPLRKFWKHLIQLSKIETRRITVSKNNKFPEVQRCPNLENKTLSLEDTTIINHYTIL